MAPTTEEAAPVRAPTVDATPTSGTSAGETATGASTSERAAGEDKTKPDGEVAALPATKRTKSEAVAKVDGDGHAKLSAVDKEGDVDMASAVEAETAAESEKEAPQESTAKQAVAGKPEEANSASQKAKEQTHAEKDVAIRSNASKPEADSKPEATANASSTEAGASVVVAAEPEKTVATTVSDSTTETKATVKAGTASSTPAATPAFEASTPAVDVKTEDGKQPKQATAVVPSAQKKSGTTECSPVKRKEPVKETPTDPAAKSGDATASSASTEPAAKKQKLENSASVSTDKPKSPETPEMSADSTTTADNAPLAAVLSRDDMAKIEEDGGLLKFDVITNDGTPEHMMQLTTLKNIFAKQLPKMPKEYIVRLVFDRNHRSMLILKNSKHVIGGICYRPFEPNHFAEIAFCAINASDQVKGYGTRLMNHLKEYVKTKGITHFLTYADNYAIGYFKKQGFSKVVSMPRPNWYGYIKDYDGGTLMECTIHYQINYLRITSMIHMQRKAIQEKIKQQSHAHRVYPGLSKFADGRLMDIYMVPGVKEAGWSQAVIRNNRIGTRDQGSLKTQLSQLLKAVSNHRSAWPFHEPVDTSIVVDYLDHIKNPVDLQMINKRVESGAYLSKVAFKADLDLMCTNCMTYNTPETNYYKAAKDLQEFINTRIQIREQFGK